MTFFFFFFAGDSNAGATRYGEAENYVSYRRLSRSEGVGYSSLRQFIAGKKRLEAASVCTFPSRVGFE